MCTEEESVASPTTTTSRRMHRARRSRRGRLAQTGLAVAVIAATAAGAVGLASTASAATAPAEEKTVVAFTATISPFSSIEIPEVVCPGATPYLVAKIFSPGRLVPDGVEVVESGFGIGVTGMTYLSYGPDKMSHGMGTPATATNWGFVDQSMAIKLHCTNDAAAGYTLPARN